MIPDITCLPEPLPLDERYAHVLDRGTRDDCAEVYWCIRPTDAAWVEVVIIRPHPPIETRALSDRESRIADGYLPTSPLAVATAGVLDASGYDAGAPDTLPPRLRALAMVDPGALLPTSDVAAALVAQKHDVTPAIEGPQSVSPVVPVSGQVEVIGGGGYVLNLQHLARAGG